MFSIITSMRLIMNGNVECRDMPASEPFPALECAIRLRASTAAMFQYAWGEGWLVVSYSVVCRDVGKPA